MRPQRDRRCYRGELRVPREWARRSGTRNLPCSSSPCGRGASLRPELHRHANVLDGVVACFSNVFEREVAGGSVGVISQSGSFATIITDSLRRRGLGVSYVVSSGNEADITAGDCTFAF